MKINHITLLEFKNFSDEMINALQYAKSNCKIHPVDIFRTGRKKFAAHEKEIRQDRTPRNSTIEDTIIFNYAFWLVFGIKDIRNRVLFGTGDIVTATEYVDTRTTDIYFVYPYKSARYFVTQMDSMNIVSDVSGILGIINYYIDDRAMLSMMKKYVDPKELIQYTVDSAEKTGMMDSKELKELERNISKVIEESKNKIKQSVKEVNRIDKPYEEIWIYDTSAYLINASFLIDVFYDKISEGRYNSIIRSWKILKRKTDSKNAIEAARKIKLI